MKDILNRLINHENISSEEAKQVIVNISNDMYNPSQITCFLSVFMMRSITIEDLKGFNLDDYIYSKEHTLKSNQPVFIR